MASFSLENQLKLNITFLKFLGLWPEINGFIGAIAYFLYGIFINFFLVFLFNVSLIVNIYYLADNLESLAANGYVVLVCIMGSVKGYYVFRKNNTMKELIKGISKNELTVTPEQDEALVNYMSGWKRLHMVLAVIIPVVTGILWGIYPILDVNSPPRSLPFPAWYPYDHKASIFYEISYVHQVVSIMILAFMNSNVDTLMAGLMAYIAAEIEVLCDNMRNLRGITCDFVRKKGILDGDENKEILTNMNATLILLIRYHKKVISYAKNAENYFNSYLIFQFIVSALSIGMTMFNLSLRAPGSAEFFSIVSYQMGITTELLNYCWYGNEIILKSTSLSYATFECDWVDAPMVFKKNLAFFIHRTQKPIRIYAVNFFVLSLETFTSILRTAWSYFALLRQVNMKT